MPRSPVCVDASLVVALVIPEVQSDKAIGLWAEWMRSGVKIIAPPLLRYEVASALWRKVVRSVVELEDARRCLQEVLSLDIEFLDLPELPLRALDLAARFRRPATYDTHYLALAELMKAEFWTADERLYNAVRKGFPHIRWLGEHA